MKLFGALLVFLAMTVDASPERPLYYRGFVGVDLKNIREQLIYVRNSGYIVRSVSTGYIVGGALGYKLRKKLMLEAEIAFCENTYEYYVPYPYQYASCVVGRQYGSVKQMTSFINAVFESSLLGSCIFPSVGIGIGSEFFWEIESGAPLDFAERWNCRGHRYCGWSPVYQGIVGITAKVGENTQARVGYRYLGWKLYTAGHSLDLSITRGF